jgi:uncharacterized membrane protein YjgN (DUF898 family)
MSVVKKSMIQLMTWKFIFLIFVLITASQYNNNSIQIKFHFLAAYEGEHSQTRHTCYLCTAYYTHWLSRYFILKMRTEAVEMICCLILIFVGLCVLIPWAYFSNNRPFCGNTTFGNITFNDTFNETLLY